MSVVNISEVAANLRGNPKPEPGILSECRDIVVERLRASMSGAMDRVESDLLKKLESTAMSAEEQRLFGEAQRQLNLIRADLDQRFRAVFQRSFNLKAARADLPADVYKHSDDSPMELSLVDQDEVADEVSLQNMALQMRNRCDNELSELSPRLAFLLGKQQITDEQDPFGPDAICGVLKELCWQLDSSRRVKLIILDRLSGSLSEDVVKLYREMNEHLVKRKVLPRVRHVIRRSGGGAVPRSGNDVLANDAKNHENDIGVMPEGDLLAGLQQVLASRAGHGGAIAGAPQVSGLSGSELLGALTRFQHGETTVPDGFETVVMADDGGLQNILHALKQSSFGAQVAPFDGLMIDIVATMFDYIFEDPRVPDLMKGLIGRLQIPLLKVAMTDRGFFSVKSHPARRFLNALAAAGTDWGDELTHDSLLYRKAESLVLKLQAEFEEDIGLISDCLAEFEQFLEENERIAEEKTAEITGELEERERHEIALTVANATVQPYLDDDSLALPVKNFLEASWVPVLVEAYRQGGEESAQLTAAVVTMDDLVWSVRPKLGAEARKLLVQRLPILLKQLRIGLDSVGTPAEDRERFFSQLVGLHAAAVKAGMMAANQAAQMMMGMALPQGLAVAPPPPPSWSAASRAAPAAASAAASAASAAPAPSVIAKAPAVAQSAALDQLRRGSWVEFRDGYDEPMRVRLTWVSPARTMYLFTNRQGQRALALTRNELLEKFDMEAARLADDTPLIDRVVESVLESIQVEDTGEI